MRTFASNQTVNILENGDITMEVHKVTVRGPRRIQWRHFNQTSMENSVYLERKRKKITETESKLSNSAWGEKRKELAVVSNIYTHVLNMFKVVILASFYKMRSCYVHFTSKSYSEGTQLLALKMKVLISLEYKWHFDAKNNPRLALHITAIWKRNLYQLN
ncbi:PREDICTED: 60S ribosomal protein L9-like [Chinchilla lanigera]|uniref:60S ribosomal protein L9-like n=1 Tax=Chinchilla lanigera TaxID=34839 RepID=UPI00038F09BD|nr:PREDICTED: 60S ribosomal protein L9-like [Chinchilla lanigera]